MAESLAGFFEKHGARSGTGFRSEPWYNRSGDSIHYHWRPDEFFRDRIDDKLTVYRAISSKDAVGCEIKGVTALIKMIGDFGISLNEQDGTPLAMFLFASQATASDVAKDLSERQKTYWYLLEQVGKQKIELEE